MYKYTKECKNIFFLFILLFLLLFVDGCAEPKSRRYETVPYAQSAFPIEVATVSDSIGIHLLWASSDQGINYQRRDTTAQIWTEPYRLSDQSGSELLMKSSGSVLHAFWIGEELHYYKSLDGGASWQPARVKIVPEDVGARHLSVLASGSALHLLVTSADDQVWYVQGDEKGSSWTRPFGLALTDVYHRTRGTLGLDQNGNLYAIWAEIDLQNDGNSQGSILGRKRLNEGREWGEPVQLFSQKNVQVREPVVAAADTLFVVWKGGGDDLATDLYWQTSGDGGASWSGLATLTRGWPDKRYQLRRCDSASVCLLWTDKRHAKTEWWYRIPIVGAVWSLNADVDPIWENNDIYISTNSVKTQWGNEQRLTPPLSYVHTFDAEWTKEGLYVLWSGKHDIDKTVDNTRLPHQVYWSWHSLSK